LVEYVEAIIFHQDNEKGVAKRPFLLTKNAVARSNGVVSAEIKQRARPYWNGGIWYKRTHGTEYR